ncbi:OsmC family protein [Paenibacillus cisolokensis]|uniref:OsmC family protein n=1 Tax=Paenibacillus cisolokensis TaxID=1658519 RepID=UPI001BCC7974|nr:OsmC family protein [Paenibacillus cisolokensis]
MITVKWFEGKYHVQDGRQAIWGTEASQAWTPVELLESSLALCVAKSLNIRMDQDGVSADDFTVVVHSNKSASGVPRLESFNVEVQLPAYLHPEYKDKLLRQASQICTIGNTLKRGAEIGYETI